MNISKAINFLYPELSSDIDYNVRDNSDGDGPQLQWFNIEIKRPTKTQLEKAWKEVTKKESIKEIDQATQKKIFAKYSDNKQRTLLMRAMSGDTAEFQEMTVFVQACLAEGQAKKDAL